MASNADAGGIHIIHIGQYLYRFVQTHGDGTKAFNVFRITVVGHVLGQHHIAPAGQLNEVEILHTFVVIHTVADDNSRGRIFSRGSVRNEEPAIHGVARSGFPIDLGDRNLTKAGLNGHGHNAA